MNFSLPFSWCFHLLNREQQLLMSLSYHKAVNQTLQEKSILQKALFSESIFLIKNTQGKGHLSFAN